MTETTLGPDVRPPSISDGIVAHQAQNNVVISTGHSFIPSGNRSKDGLGHPGMSNANAQGFCPDAFTHQNIALHRSQIDDNTLPAHGGLVNTVAFAMPPDRVPCLSDAKMARVCSSSRLESANATFFSIMIAMAILGIRLKRPDA